VFLKELSATCFVILRNSALGIETSHVGLRSVLKRENMISFDTLPKGTLQRGRKSQVQTHWGFPFLSPPFPKHFIISEKLGLINFHGGNYNHFYLCRVLLWS
jgi:hypothetical protein